MTDRDPTQEHPSQYSYEVLDAMTAPLRTFGLPVHDPFAGTGVRLGALCDRLRLDFTGTELVGAFIVDERVNAGDSTYPDNYPEPPFVIATSPVYPNGMADHFKATEPEGRHTYRQALHRLVGHDVPLAETNMGRYSIRRGPKAFEIYATLATTIAGWWWPAPVVLNVSDFYVGESVFPLTRFWRDLLRSHGYKFAAPVNVRTRRQRHGANGDRRVEFEHVLTAFPAERTTRSGSDTPLAEPQSVPEIYRDLTDLFGLRERLT
jgi:hypothetical protein